MRFSLFVKLAVFFTAIIFLSGLTAAFSFGAYGERNMLEEMDQRIDTLTESLQSLYRAGNLTPETLASLNQLSFFESVLFDDPEALASDTRVHRYFSADELAALPVFKRIDSHYKDAPFKNARFPATLVLLEREDSRAYLFISPNLSLNMVQMRPYVFQTIGLFFLTAFLLILLAGRKFLKPMKKLAEAARKITDGDYSVRVPYPHRDELGDVVSNFNAMATELQSVEILRSGFVADISHEFRTPLMAIEGYVNLLRDCEDESERDQYISVITKETARLSRLSQSILLLNRLENENALTGREVFRLDEQIRQAVLLCENTWSARNLQFGMELAEVTYTGRPELLAQVWLNLLDNAIRFSPENGEIRLSLRQNGDIRFTIQDQGPGVREASRVFDKFYKEDQARSGEGNGLGLSIVKRIVQLHGGAISLRSDPGQGAAFEVVLPDASTPATMHEKRAK